VSAASNRFLAALASANPNAVLKREDKDFSVADLAGLSRAAPFDNRIDRRLDELLIHGNLKLNFAQQIDRHLMPAENLRVPLLPAKTLHIHNRQAKDLDLGERGFDSFQPAGLNDGNDQLHKKTLLRDRKCIVNHRSLERQPAMSIRFSGWHAL
jgi:hypothetical protein